MKIPIEALELAKLADKDGGRPNMEYIEIKPGAKNTAIATATDTHILGRVTWFCEPFPKPIYLLAVDVIAALKGKTKKEKLAGGTLGEGTLEIGNSIHLVKTDFEWTFPNTDQVIPMFHEGCTETGVNLKFLNQIKDWTQGSDRSSVMKLSVPKDAMSPLRLDTGEALDAQAPTALFVVMPCRI